MATTAGRTAFNANQRMSSGKRMQPSGGMSESSEQPFSRVLHAAQNYARENPESAALWCFGIGFVLGWKLKPW
jgi:hypothetical protein